MSAEPITLSAPKARTHNSPPSGLSCPLASRCSCVFTRLQPADQLSTSAPATSADSSAAGRALAAELSTWLDWGWSVADSTATEVVVERRRGFSFCVNAALTAVTGLLWLIYWVPRARRPRFARVTISVSPTGTVSTTSPLH